MSWGSTDTKIEKSVTTLEDESMATNQEAVPVPYLAGSNKIALTWISPVYNQLTKPHIDSNYNNKKAGGEATSWDYYGTLIGAICEGPIFGIEKIIIDGEEAWPAQEAWKQGVTYAQYVVRSYNGRSWLSLSAHTSDATNGPWNPTYWQLYYIARDAAWHNIQTGKGGLYLGWGTTYGAVPTQLSGNHWLQEHPEYRWICYLIPTSYNFGEGRTSTPNIEVVVMRQPWQNIINIATAPGSVTDGQANVAAVLAELLTSPNGCNLPETGDDSPDPVSFNATANLLQTYQSLCGVSLLLNEQKTMAAILTDLASVSNVWMRYDFATRRIVLGLWRAGTPAEHHELTMDDLTEAPKFTAGGWGDAISDCSVTFKDRCANYKTRPAKGQTDMRVVGVLGRHRTEFVTRDCIARKNQATAHGTEYIREKGRPQLDGTISVRREKGRAILPGHWLTLDIELEPGGATITQWFKVLERRTPYHGPIELTLDADETVTPIYSAPIDDGVPDRPADAVALIANARIIEAPGLLAQDDPSVLALIERPSEVIVGCEVWYDPATDGDFARLGKATAFATRATLRTALTDSASTVEIDVPAQVDLERLADQPGSVGAANDVLLCVLVKTAAGQVANTAGGYSYLEICSISAQAEGENEGEYDLTVLRGRQGTTTAAFLTADTEVWIVPKASLVNFLHRDFDGLRSTGDSAFFRLKPYTRKTTAALVDATSIEFTFPLHGPHVPALTLTAPATPSPLAAGPTYPESIEFSGTWTDPDGDLTGYKILRYKSGDTPEEVVNESFAGRTSKAFTVQIAIDEAGTWYVELIAFDAPGHCARKVYQIVAEAGTAKCAKPKLSLYGVRLSESSSHATPSGLNSGWYSFACESSGVTIKYQICTWDGAAYGAWGDEETAIYSGIWGRYTNPPLDWKIRIKATKAGMTDSDYATFTLSG